MKLQNPVCIDLFKFIVNGEFDCIKLGQTKEWILNNFPDPDCISDMGHGMFIWKYGNLEFHFKDDLLYLIWCDNFRDFGAGNNIILNKWFLNKAINNLPKVLRLLNQNKISFSLIHNEKLQNIKIRILKSDVDLHFDIKDDKSYENLDDAMFILIGFGKASF